MSEFDGNDILLKAASRVEEGKWVQSKWFAEFQQISIDAAVGFQWFSIQRSHAMKRLTEGAEIHGCALGTLDLVAAEIGASQPALRSARAKLAHTVRKAVGKEQFFGVAHWNDHGDRRAWEVAEMMRRAADA